MLEFEGTFLREHFMKYNLRFIWKTAGLDASRIRELQPVVHPKMSNVASYQLNRNELEKELLRRNIKQAINPSTITRYDLQIDLSTDETPHTVSYQHEQTQLGESPLGGGLCRSGACAAKNSQLAKSNNIRHGASFLWVDRAVEEYRDAHRLDAGTNAAKPTAVPDCVRSEENHFVEEGLWLWVMPVAGYRSLGLVYDRHVVNPDDVNDPAKLVNHAALSSVRQRSAEAKGLHSGGYRDYWFDAARQ